MTERELIINRVEPVVRRLRELGAEVPEMPEGEETEPFEWQKQIMKLWQETMKRGS